MTNGLKKYLSAILTVLLAVGILISASSCNYTYDALVGGGSNEQQVEEEQKKDESASNSTSDTQSGAEEESSDDPVFYPGGNGGANTDSLDPRVKALTSVVAIDAKLDLKTSYPYYGSGTTTEYTSYGSGVIYSLDREAGDAYVITNYHVVYNKDEVAQGGFSDSVSLYLYGMESKQYAIEAKVIGGSMTYDIAVLKVEGSEVLKNSAASAATLGDSELVRVFDEVYAIGNPEGYGISATEGTVSVESESLSMTGADQRTAINLRVMRVSAAINDGNSGGGLFDSEGRLIGIVNAKRTGSEVDNIGYAIPVNLAKKLADNILRNCDGADNLSILKCVVGIELVARSSGLLPDGKGNLVIAEEVMVSSVQETSIAKESIMAEDVITAITVDGRTTAVTRVHHLVDAMLDANVGSTVVLRVTRGAESFDLTLTIPEEALTTVK